MSFASSKLEQGKVSKGHIGTGRLRRKGKLPSESVIIAASPRISSRIGNEGRPRSSASSTSRRSAEPVPRIRAPFRLSSLCRSPSHGTHSPGRNSRRRAESGGAVVVSLLREFGHQLLTTDAFGQRMLTFQFTIRGGGTFLCAPRIAEFPKCDQELTRLREKCTVCPDIDDLVGIR